MAPLRVVTWGLTLVALAAVIAAIWPAFGPTSRGNVVYTPQLVLAALNLAVAIGIAGFTEYREHVARARRHQAIGLLVDYELAHLHHQLTMLAKPGRPRIGEFAFPAVRQALDANVEVKLSMRHRLASFFHLLSQVETLLARCLANPDAILFRGDLQRAAHIALQELEHWGIGKGAGHRQ
jgi:hypothetical protein